MEANKVAITTPFIKLSAFLKFAGVTDTGGVGGMLIADGLVGVNGEICLQRGRKLYPGDVVTVDGQITLEVTDADNGN